MKNLMYLTVSGEDKILSFWEDPDTGALEPIGETAVSGGPASMTLTPDEKYLCVARRKINQISSYRVDPRTGTLELVNSATLETDPCDLRTDRSGRYLFSAYYRGGLCAVHAIDRDGSIRSPAIEWRHTGLGAHSMQSDPSNRFVFVPHIANEGPQEATATCPNTIFQFRFDARSGKLTPNSPPQVFPGEVAGPRHLCFHPTLNVVYFTNEQGCSVSAYTLDPERGTLTMFQTLSTLPEGADRTGASCAKIQISRDGRFVFAPNRGHNSIACLATDPATGALSRTAVVATERHPRAISLDPAGRFFFAAGLESGRLASYRVDQHSGVLDPLQIHPVGKAPMFVTIQSAGGS